MHAAVASRCKLFILRNAVTIGHVYLKRVTKLGLALCLLSFQQASAQAPDDVNSKIQAMEQRIKALESELSDLKAALAATPTAPPAAPTAAAAPLPVQAGPSVAAAPQLSDAT